MSDFNHDMMPIYYKQLFPFGPYYRWLSYGNTKENYLQNREFSFTLADDIYIRYQSFNDQSQLEEEIQKLCPHKIDIGAVYNYRPKGHKTVTGFIPLEKELVFDIDMTDYDEVRTCCSGADICLKCWKLMVVAVKVLDVALREDFGFQHLLWVFSGRRGVHCWVCDESARSLDQQARSAVAEYLQLIKGGEQTLKKVNLNQDRLHPSISRAVEIIEPYFASMMLNEQDILGSEAQIKSFLGLVPDQQLRAKLETEMLRQSDCASRWEVFEEMTTKIKKNQRQANNLVKEVMLQMTYPRLDINVSKQLNHLLKSPFCVHPKTGKICIPFDPKYADQFNPDTVPTLPALIDELNEDKTSEDGEKKLRPYERTSLNSSILLFKKFLANLEASWKHKKIAASDAKMEF